MSDLTDTAGLTGASTGTSDGTSGTFPAGSFDCGGCYGRPYVVENSVRTASAIETDAWSRPARVDADLSDDERRALASFWTEAGLAEHSSVAGFHRFALDLLAHGAPIELVARAQKAALQELEHAQACFALAGAYAGHPVGPGPMPLGTSAPIASTLRELAVWTVHEGCVGETTAAWLAAEIHARTQDASVREVMAKIAAEEAEHAELAWATIRWAIDVGGREVADAVAAAFSVARTTPPTPHAIACPEHGLLPAAAMEAAMRRALHDVVLPCARELVAA